MRRRIDPDKRKQEILEAAIGQAHKVGYMQMTRDQIAERCAVSRGLITPHYYATMDELRDAVITAAVDRAIVAIVLQGLAARDPIALDAPESLRIQVASMFL